MKIFTTISLAFLIILVGCNTQQNLSTTNPKEIMKNKESINEFYNKALTVNNQTRPTAVLTPLFAEGYMSSSSVDSKGPQKLMGQVEFFWKIIPDLKWEPQEILNEGDTYIVRSIDLMIVILFGVMFLDCSLLEKSIGIILPSQSLTIFQALVAVIVH